MKKIRYSIFLIICFTCFSCTSSHNSQKLNNTKWFYNFGHEDVISCFFFIDSRKYQFYNAEKGDTTFGSYSFKNDTIFLNQEYGSFDNEFSENSKHKTQKLKFKMLLRNETQLGFIEQWDDLNKRWIENYFFSKLKNN
jgi:hypothetical protein